MKYKIDERKLEHIKIVLENDVTPNFNSLDKYFLPYSALPEIDMKKIDTSMDFLGYKLSIPLLVGAMTGGPASVYEINKNLAIACEEEKIGLCLGSMKIALKDDSYKSTFQVKKYCPNVPVIANIGLVQLNYGYGINEINKIIDIAEADAIFFHINHLQEAIQPEGDTNFSNLISKLEKIKNKIKKPIMVKEVGCGIDKNTCKKLADIGIEYINVSGIGGTSWSRVEAYRRNDDIGFLFDHEGIPLDKAISDCKSVFNGNIIAEGGIESGLDMAKTLMLGANICSIAKSFLQPAIKSSEECIKLIQRFKKELEISMFITGAIDIEQLKKQKLVTDY